MFELETMMRFRDPVLRQVLEKMRTPERARLSDNEWKASVATNVEASTMDEAAEQELLTKTHDWYHSCYLWCIIKLPIHLLN